MTKIAYSVTASLPRSAWIYYVCVYGNQVDTAWSLASAEALVSDRMRMLDPERRKGVTIKAERA